MDAELEDTVAGLAARIDAISIVLAEIVEAIEHRMPGLKPELTACLLVQERGETDAHRHRAGVAQLRRMREELEGCQLSAMQLGRLPTHEPAAVADRG